ncbi:RidA family protein [uncultured Marinobacter sp.]|uniref:RidA family protein n=1 Tax=uncultured Marinobacter sp. TaxID=187379 RepID=UPI002613629D|nr:RidA family protein [uncultured Marinobacter sp.]
MNIQRFETGPRMSKVVTHNQTAYLAGQVGEATGSIAEQTREALSRVDALLQSVGSDRKHLLQVIVWLADMSDFEEMNAVWDAWVPTGHAPARACGEARLASPELKVEVIATAAIRA